MTLIQKSPQSIKICVGLTPLYFTANTAGSTVKLKIGYGTPASVNLEKSTNGTIWSDYTIGSTITLSSVGDKVYFRNKSETDTSFSTSTVNYYQFEMSGDINGDGDTTSLLNKNGTDTASAYCFFDLFQNCTALKTPPRLPATTVSGYSYYNMFYGCSGLTEAPSLPAITLGGACYAYMFYYCTSLATIPELPATTLPNSCYMRMFQGCSKIKISSSQTGEYQTPYRIPTTGTGTVGTRPLEEMLGGTGGTYTSDPNVNQTYYTSNTVVPATTLPIKEVKKVYIGSTQVRPELPPYLCFTANTAGSTVQLTQNGTPTTVTLEISADGENWSNYTIGNTITLSNVGDKIYMRNKSETTTGFSTSGSDYYRFDMTGSIEASGNITSLINKNLTDTVSDYCFYWLFSGCTALTTPPELPATTLGIQCYYGIFFQCSSLTVSPELPATTLKEFCYAHMFNGCSALTTAPSLPATTLTERCYYCMFYKCTSLNMLPSLPATTLPNYCYNSMFNGCSSIKLSSNRTGEYQTEYRIPTTGSGTHDISSLSNMFKNTGGTFTGTPSINTTYYTSNTVV